MASVTARDICLAVQEGQIDKIRELVNGSPEIVNAEMKDGTSPLFYAKTKRGRRVLAGAWCARQWHLEGWTHAIARRIAEWLSRSGGAAS